MANIPATTEGRIARWANVALGGSIALPAILLFLALSTNVPALCLLVAILFLQIWPLRNIERYAAKFVFESGRAPSQHIFWRLPRVL